MKVMKKGLLLLCVTLLTSVILTACGGVNENEESNQIKESPAAETGKVRTFEHILGKIEVPERPQRVIGLFVEDEMSALGVKPIMQYSSGSYYQTYLEPYLKDVPKLDTAAMNFEAIMAAKPDLIILGFQGWADEGSYEKLSKIAPTYVFTGSEIQTPENWRKNLRTVADLLGKSDVAEEIIKKREEETKNAKQLLADSSGRGTAALLRIHASKELRLYGGPGGQVGTALYGDFGLEPSGIVRKLAWGEDMDIQTISMEVIPQIDADYLFLAVDEGRREQAKELMESPIWKNVPAVKKGHVYEVRGDVWITNGPIAYEKKLEDVVNAMTKQ
ncbi:ABC transporter substrate-binding protein [Cohnella abietis]|uniref:Ferrichrome ABC transporter substrate-binding protein n=1 Tax=Cohnella abietis TaxID=2507935 RepID=A0A3T1D5Q8_9BACL|nr:ABC transporter substrate-binding protein [Cohnella abietis]BBI33443.1 ferrichrome ABC transporter substrate-binding protein [Cohnella abietis]